MRHFLMVAVLVLGTVACSNAGYSDGGYDDRNCYGRESVGMAAGSVLGVVNSTVFAQARGSSSSRSSSSSSNRSSSSTSRAPSRPAAPAPRPAAPPRSGTINQNRQPAPPRVAAPRTQRPSYSNRYRPPPVIYYHDDWDADWPYYPEGQYPPGVDRTYYDMNCRDD